MHKIALLGCGRIGRIHAANAVANPALHLSHVVDRAEMDHFADMLSGKTGPAVDYADGVAALKLAEAAIQSMTSGQPVKLNG